MTLAAAELQLDLTSIADRDFQNIDTIDIRGSGSNGVTLDANEIANISQLSDQLSVIADGDDLVDFGSGWTFSQSLVEAGLFFRSSSRTALRCCPAGHSIGEIQQILAMWTAMARLSRSMCCSSSIC